MTVSRLVLAGAFAAGVIAPIMAGSSGGMTGFPVRGFENRSRNDVRLFWTATRTSSGRIIGSNQGLVELVGGEWRQLTSEGNFEWQTLLPDDHGRIWAAARNELGVYEPDAAGNLHYRSLTTLVPGREGGIGDTWGVYPFEDSVVFVGGGPVVMTDGQGARLWNLPCVRRLYSWVDGGALYIADESAGIYKMTRDGPVAVSSEVPVKAQGYFWTENLGNPGWIVSSDRGFDTADSGASGKFEALNKTWLRAAAVQQRRLDDGRLAVATYFGGLLLVDTGTGAFQQLSLSEGMSSAAILGIFPEGRDWLWLVTNRGMDRVAVSGAVTALRNGSGIDGVVLHGVERAKDVAIISTDSGRFSVPLSDSTREIRQIGEKWYYNTVRFGDQTLAGGMRGLYSIGGDKARKILQEANDIESVVVPPNSSDLIIYSTDSALRAAVMREGSFVVSATVEMDSPIDSMSEDAGGDIWVAAGKTVARFSLAATGDRFVPRESHEIPAEVRTPAAKTQLFAVGDSIYGICDGVLLARDPGGRGFLPVPEFAEAEFSGAVSARTGVAWALARPVRHDSESPRLVRLSQARGRLVAEEMDAPGILTLGSLRNIHSVEDGAENPELWIGATGGILRVDPGRIRPVEPLPRLAVGMKVKSPGGSGNAAEPVPELSNQDASPAFLWSGPGSATGDLMAESRLFGAETRWVPAGFGVERGFAGLADGRYTFEVRAVDALGRPGPVASRSFVVLPPWYRTTGALVGLSISALALIFAGWTWRGRAMRRRADELEGMVEERTRELELVNAEKTRFIARMNHEIRNPLNGLLGAIGVLEQYAHSGREGRMMDILRTCADHLSAVVEDVLDFSSIEGGRIVLQERAFSVAEVVEAVPRMMLAESERTGTEVVTGIGSGVPPVVVGDPDRIRQILVNFLGNALKYAPGEPVHIDVSLVSLDAESCIRFAVRDHGPGISESDKAALFSMFERGKAASKRNVRGMGIGLATCRLLARRMGGEVGVISGLGEGSEFFLRLPLKAAGVPEVPGNAPLPELQKLSCLIIEDQDFNRDILKDMLVRLGCTVDEAADAEAGLNLAAVNLYDVVFTDLELPDAAPGEILKHLVAQQPPEVASRPALVVTTAYATENVRQTCVAAGARAFLAKPLSQSKVLDVLREIDAARRPSAGTMAAPAPATREASQGVIGHLARIRGCDVSSVAAEIAKGIAGEIASIRESSRQSNVVEVAKQAHRILSLATLAGSPELAAAAVRVQNDAREGRLPSEESLGALAAAAVGARERLSSLNPAGEG